MSYPGDSSIFTKIIIILVSKKFSKKCHNGGVFIKFIMDCI